MPDFDFIFKNATVIDGTGADRFKADVAVKGAKMEAVGSLGMDAARVIDCEGRILCPGFVDMHGHSDYFLLILPSAEGKIKQGVTTEVGGNCGYSAAPVSGETKKDRAQSHKELYDLDVDWTDFGQFLDCLEKAEPAINYIPLFGFNTIRSSAGLYSTKPPQGDELKAMRSMAEEAMDSGAFGMSMGLIYAPASFASIGEIASFGKIVAEKGGILASHIRSEGEKLIEAIEESIEICERSGAAFQVSHLKTSGTANWSKLDKVFELIENARAKGLKITADRYPYLASFTQLSAALPEWVFEGGKKKFYERLADEGERARMRNELAESDELGDRWSRVHVSQAFGDGLAKYEGRQVSDCADEENQDPIDFVCELLIAAKDRVAATYHTMSEDNLARIYKKDWVMIGSDAAVRTHAGFLSEGKPHPRAYGTMPRVLSWVAREKKWITLEQAVRKMSKDPCDVLGIKDRGVVKAGMAADLVVFDPGKVRDTATYDNPQQYPEGMELVMVNGRVAVENGELTGERAGRVLKKK